MLKKKKVLHAFVLSLENFNSKLSIKNKVSTKRCIGET